MKDLLFVSDAGSWSAALSPGETGTWTVEIVAKTGGALDELRRRRPDVVVFDADAEHDIAWSLLARLKSDPDTAVASTRAVMIGPAGEMSRLRAAIEGALAYVAKPVETSELQRALASALAGADERVRRREAQQRALHELARLEHPRAHDPPAPARRRYTASGPPACDLAAGSTPASLDIDLDRLSDKQRAVLSALAGMPSNAAAARLLGISASRVSAQVGAVAKRLGVDRRSVVELARTGALALSTPSAADVASELPTAMERGELSLAYQPIVSLATGAVTGAEALLRWNHGRHGALRPAAFLPVAEATAMVRPFTQWVLREASSQLDRWKSDFPEIDLDVTVNVSASQATSGEIVHLVERLLATSGVAPASLVFDIPAVSLVARPDAVVATVTRLKRLGVMVAIDDFAGSTLRALERCRVDIVKIEWSFVAGLGRSASDTAIVEAAIRVGAALDIDTLAKGVETQAQLDTLAAFGCRFAQGYQLSPPLSSGQFSALLANSPGEKRRSELGATGPNRR